jgi:hypothetical protein
MYLLEQSALLSRNNGFKMENYFVWCGSIIKVGETYHMFAARWPRATGFPDGYRNFSEIVRAEAGRAEGPYLFKEIIIGKREGNFWDSKMAHNPFILKIGDEYVLYYIGSSNSSGSRKVGYALSKDIEGPWKRIDEPISLTEDANNPSPLVEKDGSIKLVFRDLHLHMGIAKAENYNSVYHIVNHDIVTEVPLEDPFLYFKDGKYHIICEDNQGKLTGHVRWGVHLESEDGVKNWKTTKPIIAYDHTIRWEDGETIILERRERPQLLFNESGGITHLITSALYQGNSWCVVQPVFEQKYITNSTQV